MRKYIAVGLAVFAADRATKLVAARALEARQSVTVLEGVLAFTYARNTGMAFSILGGNNAALIVLTALLIAVVGWMAYAMRAHTAWIRAGLTLVMAGGLGNLLDRLLYGYVIDFIEPLFVEFAIFNIADCAVCVGALLAAIGYAIEERRDKRDMAG